MSLVTRALKLLSLAEPKSPGSFHTCSHVAIPNVEIHFLAIRCNFLICGVGNCRAKSKSAAYSSFSGNASNIVGERSRPTAIRLTDSIVIDANPCSILDKCPFDIPLASASWLKEIPSSRRKLRIRSPNSSVNGVVWVRLGMTFDYHDEIRRVKPFYTKPLGFDTILVRRMRGMFVRVAFLEDSSSFLHGR